MVKNISTVVFTIFNCFLHFHGGGNVKNNNLKADKMSIGILGAGDEYPHKPMGENDKEETTLMHLFYPPSTAARRLIRCSYLKTELMQRLLDQYILHYHQILILA